MCRMHHRNRDCGAGGELNGGRWAYDDGRPIRYGVAYEWIGLSVGLVLHGLATR